MYVLLLVVPSPGIIVGPRQSDPPPPPHHPSPLSSIQTRRLVMESKADNTTRMALRTVQACVLTNNSDAAILSLMEEHIATMAYPLANRKIMSGSIMAAPLCALLETRKLIRFSRGLLYYMQPLSVLIYPIFHCWQQKTYYIHIAIKGCIVEALVQERTLLWIHVSWLCYETWWTYRVLSAPLSPTYWTWILCTNINAHHIHLEHPTRQTHTFILPCQLSGFLYGAERTVSTIISFREPKVLIKFLRCLFVAFMGTWIDVLSNTMLTNGAIMDTGLMKRILWNSLFV